MPIKYFLSLKGYKYCQWLSFAMLSSFALVKPAYAEELNNTANSHQNSQYNQESNILASKARILKDAIQIKISKRANLDLPNSNSYSNSYTCHHYHFLGQNQPS